MMMRRHHNQHQQQQQRRDRRSRDFYELVDLTLNLLRSPIPFSDQALEMSVPDRRRRSHESQITPAGFASLLLGISLALMLCGSVTFFLGFMLMPWVIGLILVFYIIGIVSTVSMLGRSIVCYALPSSPSKEIPAWKLL